MSVERLQRVLWRLRKRCPNNDTPTYIDLRHAIMWECGTDPSTYRRNKKAMKDLGWIESYNKHKLRLTGRDLTDT